MFLERNFNKCPKNVKENCINALVRPIVDYSCTAWDPFRKDQIDKLELLNKRAARFVTGNYTREHGKTEKNMNLLGWPPLAVRRSKIKLNMLYKINHNLIHIPSDDLKINPRKPLKYLLPQSSVDSHLYSLIPSTVRLWNFIPNHCKSCVSLGTFKSSLDKITFDGYTN